MVLWLKLLVCLLLFLLFFAAYWRVRWHKGHLVAGNALLVLAFVSVIAGFGVSIQKILELRNSALYPDAHHVTAEMVKTVDEGTLKRARILARNIGETSDCSIFKERLAALLENSATTVADMDTLWKDAQQEGCSTKGKEPEPKESLNPFDKEDTPVSPPPIPEEPVWQEPSPGPGLGQGLRVIGDGGLKVQKYEKDE